MVKIAVAGGTGGIAREIIDALLATKKHHVTILSRKTQSPDVAKENVSYAVTDYGCPDNLAVILRGYDTVLSFITPIADQSEAFKAQRNLIDASVKAGVRRFAPSEWVSASFEHMPWYNYKEQTRQYLRDLNERSKVLEYCLFQPGILTDFLAHPYAEKKHAKTVATVFDFSGRRTISCQGSETQKITFTTIQDLANVVLRAVEYTAEWPVNGGISGSDLSVKQVAALGEKIRGTFRVDEVQPSLLEAGIWSCSWFPQIEHVGLSPESAEAISKTLSTGILLGIRAGAFHSNNSWGALLPDYAFEGADYFLTKIWHDKP